jgi:hypothetical protein
VQASAGRPVQDSVEQCSQRRPVQPGSKSRPAQTSSGQCRPIWPGQPVLGIVGYSNRSVQYSGTVPNFEEQRKGMSKQTSDGNYIRSKLTDLCNTCGYCLHISQIQKEKEWKIVILPHDGGLAKISDLHHASLFN